MVDEEIVKDDEIIDDENDPQSITKVPDDTAEKDHDFVNEKEIEKLSHAKQFSGEEDIIGTGISIMKKNIIPDKPDADREKQLIKELFPNVYKRKYPDSI